MKRDKYHLLDLMALFHAAESSEVPPGVNHHKKFKIKLFFLRVYFSERTHVSKTVEFLVELYSCG